MKKFMVLVMGLVSLGVMAGCDDDSKSVKVPAAVQAAFGEMFPAASHVEWEDKGGYMVADFRSAGTVMQAWFDAAGKWYMTEEDISYAELPRAVRTAYEAGDYAAWHVDDVDKLLRNGQETVYVLEVERAEQEFDLYYSEDGVLLREVPDRDGNDDHGDMLPQELSKAISDFIARKYPGARIVDAEREKGNTEVDIIFAGKALEVCFGTGDAWLWTKTGVRLSEVPDVVRRTLQSSQYGTWGSTMLTSTKAPTACGTPSRWKTRSPNGRRRCVSSRTAPCSDRPVCFCGACIPEVRAPFFFVIT